VQILVAKSINPGIISAEQPFVTEIGAEGLMMSLDDRRQYCCCVTAAICTYNPVLADQNRIDSDGRTWRI